MVSECFRSKRWQWLHLQTSSPRSCLRIGTESCHRLSMELPWIRKWAQTRLDLAMVRDWIGGFSPSFRTPEISEISSGQNLELYPSARHDGDFPGFRRALGGLRSAWPGQLWQISRGFPAITGIPPTNWSTLWMKWWSTLGTPTLPIHSFPHVSMAINWRMFNHFETHPLHHHQSQEAQSEMSTSIFKL